MNDSLSVLLFFGLPPLFCIFFLLYTIINWEEQDFKLSDNSKPRSGLRILILIFSSYWVGFLMVILKLIGWSELISN